MQSAIYQGYSMTVRAGTEVTIIDGLKFYIFVIVKSAKKR